MSPRLFAAVAALALAGGCGQRLPPPAPTSAYVSSKPDAPADAYRLGPGDKLRIIVFGEEALSNEYAVSSTGAVAFPLIGQIDAGGTTVADLRQAITAKLAAGYIRDPRVSVEVLTYRTYFILGEVTKPGEYPYSAGLTVPQAVAAAGGFTYRANQRKLAIKHNSEATEQSYDLRGPAISVQPGDTIRVIERFF